MEEYRFVCPSIDGFVQRVVVLSQRGYRYFVQGEVPERKSPEAIDEKFLAKYELRKTRRQRSYRKESGLSNGHYFRFGRTWVAMATSREFFLKVDQNEDVLDLRETPIRVGGYSLSLRRDGSADRHGEHRYRASVRLELETYLELRAYFEDLAVHRTKEGLAAEFWRLSSNWQSYAPVYRQFRAVLRRVNERRGEAGFGRLGGECIRRHRTPPRHFDRETEVTDRITLSQETKSVEERRDAAATGDSSRELGIDVSLRGSFAVPVR